MFKKLIYVSIGVLISIVILLTSVEIVTFNMSHYEKSFEKYNITEATGMDKENLMDTIEDTVEYFRDDRELLDTRAVIHGEDRDVFNEREISHMVDVKDLFVVGTLIRNISIVIILVLVGFIIKVDNSWKIRIAKTLKYTSIINTALLGVLILLLNMDFYKYFTYFHLIFFNNDLWILDPRTDVLIQMVPEGFFFDTAIKIGIIFIGAILIIGIIGIYFERKNRSKYVH